MSHKKGSLAIEGMGMYLIAVILAIITIISLIYLGGNVISHLYLFFKYKLLGPFLKLGR